MNLQYLQFARFDLDWIAIRPREVSGFPSDIVYHKSENILAGYKDLFSKYNKKVDFLLEIGVADGASLIMWHLVFDCKVMGIDYQDRVEYKTKKWMEMRPIVVHLANSMDVPRVEECVNLEFPHGIDIIIDDGSHCIDETRVSAGHLFKFVNPGGLYIIEDWQALHPIHQKVLFDYLVEQGHKDIIKHENFLVLRK